MTIALALAGCAIVDQFSGRAVGFNIEAEQALDQGLLLNIVRASQRRPMQFTSVQSISGTASASASASTTIPFGAGGAQYKTGTFGTNISGGPTFSVPVLDTQEFYYGVMSPISGQLFDFFINEEYPREELFTLFVEKIVIHLDRCAASDHTTECELVLVNYPGSDLQFDLTQAMIEHLLNLGITTEMVAAAKTASSGTSTPAQYRFCFALRDRNYGNSITDKAAHCGYVTPPTHKSQNDTTTTTSSKKTEKTDASGAKETATESGKTVAVAPKAAGTASGDQSENKKKTLAGLALSDHFIRRLKQIAELTQDPDRNRDYSEFVKHIDWFRGIDASGKVIKYPVKVKVPDKKGQKQPGKIVFKPNAVTVSIYTRSTEGVLYFLGEVVRHRLYPDKIIQPGQSPRTIQVKIETTSYRQFPEAPCELLQQIQSEDNAPTNFSCQNLFVLETAPDLANPGALSVSYNGERFWVPSDRHAAGKTLHVLSIVKQLLATNTSAKSLPQTNIISVINP